MVTGNLVCTIAATATTRVSDVKQLVQARAGVPLEHQRLLLDGQELQGDALARSPGTAPGVLMLVRSLSDPRAARKHQRDPKKEEEEETAKKEKRARGEKKAHALESEEVTNLGHFRAFSSDFKALAKGEFSLVQKLASGIHGDVFSYRWKRSSGEEVVAVKKLRSERLQQMRGTPTDERTLHLEPWRQEAQAEDALTEIGVLTYLERQPDLPQSLLRMRGVFAEADFTWLVTEFADGGDLFDVAASRRVTDVELQRYMLQLFEAVAYLHKHCIAHRDISLENILLKDGSVKLMDFGMSVRSHSASGVPLRFFRAVGKDFYRAPEAYVPTTARVRAQAPESLQPGTVGMVKAGTGHLCEVRFPPDALPGKPCTAEVWGYKAQPADIFACGVCLFVLAWQCPPWGKAVLADAIFAYAHTRGTGGVEALLRHWNRPLLAPETMQLLSQTLHFEPAQRPTAATCLSSSWFDNLAPVSTADTGAEGSA